MLKKLAFVCLCLLVAGAAGTALAGGRMETIDITGHVLSGGFNDQIWANVIGMKVDVRSIPLKYSLNLGSGVVSEGVLMVPNPLGPPVLSMAEARTTLERALHTWNRIPTSYIEMKIDRTIDHPGTVGFDFVNEVTFRTADDYSFLASAQWINLIEDTTLVHGEDVDGDGDPDVSRRIKVTTDVDGDGDLEFPAGFYRAGTILDTDVQFNTKVSNGFRFTAGDPDTVTKSADLLGIAVHEFGHSHGLSHSLHNQRSDVDGTGATMFPFVDTGDPEDEAAERSLEIDDMAWSSLIYPEGTASSGPAALQRGDVAFDDVYGRITGRLRHGDLKEPIAGGHVFAVDAASGALASGAYSGTTRYSFDPADGALWIFLDSPKDHILDGRYELPVPAGRYEVGVEPVDGQPVSFFNVNLSAELGTTFGQLAFNEEYLLERVGGHHHADVEYRPRTYRAKAGRAEKVDIVTSPTMNIDDFGPLDSVGFSGVPPGSYYALAVPGADITALAGGKPFRIKAAGFHTYVTDRSAVPVFAEALLTTGSFTVHPGPPATGTATIDLERPLARATGFVGQDNDLAPLAFSNPDALGATVAAGLASGEIESLFLVLRVPTTTPFPGVSQQAPGVGLGGVPGEPDASSHYRSFFSTDDGATFQLDPRFNFRFSLRLGELRERDHD